MTGLVRLPKMGTMPRKYCLYEANAKLPNAEPKSSAERHAEMERAGLIHRVKGTPARAKFQLGVLRPGALKRFLKERD